MIPLYFVFFLGSYQLLRSLNPTKRDWILTTLCSTLLSYEALINVHKLLAFDVYSVAFNNSLQNIRNCEFFIAYCFADMLYGCFEYNISKLEGWFHHMFYIALLTTFIVAKCPGCFCIFLFCEIPTMVRGLEKLTDKKFEILFYISYILTRIFGFFLVLALFALSSPPKSLFFTLPPAFLVGSLHSYWGYKLTRKMYFKKAEKFH